LDEVLITRKDQDRFVSIAIVHDECADDIISLCAINLNDTIREERLEFVADVVQCLEDLSPVKLGLLA
jgi:hypothetical protein